MKRLINTILKLFYPPFKRFMSFSVFAYLSLGAVNTVLNIALFIFCFHLLFNQTEYGLYGTPVKSYTLSLVLAFLLTIPTGYWLAKHFAFKTELKTTAPFFKYLLVVSQGLLSDYILMKLMIEVFHFYPTGAKISSTVIVLTINYLLQKHFTFKAAA